MLGVYIPKAYLYYSMAFAVDIEMFNMRMGGHLKESAWGGKGVT